MTTCSVVRNFAVDRELVDQLLAVNPGARRAFEANRAFLGRVVRWCGEAGIDQFLDLGSGVPTVGNVHEIAHRVVPAARVAYVDFEPVAAAHARKILAGIDTATVTHADLRDPATVLGAPGVAGLLDFTRPVALLAVAVLHFVPGDVAACLADYRSALGAGSVIALSHGSVDQDDPDLAARVQASFETYRTSATPTTSRDRRQLRALLAGLDIVAPGLVDITDWPDPTNDDPVGIYGAVGRLP